jgi:hypothetical protein
MKNSLDKSAEYAFRYTLYFMVAALAALVLYAIGSTQTGFGFLAVTGIVFGIAFASGGAGAFIGFLFGIPHSLPDGSRPQAMTMTPTTPPIPLAQTPAPTGVTPTTPAMQAPFPATEMLPPPASPGNPSPPTTSGAMPPVGPPPSGGGHYSRSTNLEQIVDWLTKIIVGAGLIEIRKIILYAGRVCTWAGGAIETNGGGKSGGVIAACTLVAFLATGFLVGYLWTYLYLIQIQNEMELVNKLRAEFGQAIHDNDDNNKAASDLVNTQLSLPYLAVDIADDKLAAGLRGASGAICSMIFFHTVDWRKKFQHDSSQNFRVARTIPIFRALIQLDTGFKYPENYLQLGYSLKDQSAPDYAEACKNIDKAINNFGRAGGRVINVALAYFNRAYCRIMIDMSGTSPQPSSLVTKQLILNDLATASQDRCIADIIAQDTNLIQWKGLNP